MSDSNEAAIRRYFDEVLNRGNLAVIDEIIANDFVFHDPSAEEVLGPAGEKELVLQYRTAFPDLRVTIEDMLSEGETVVTRWSYQGTHRGPLEGVAPTGKRVSGTAITIDRFHGGKVQESWSYWDAFGLMKQLGAFQDPRQGE